MKLAEASGGREHVNAAVANQSVHGARKLVGINGIRRIDPIAVLSRKRRHHRHNALQVIGCDHLGLLVDCCRILQQAEPRVKTNSFDLYPS